MDEKIKTDDIENLLCPECGWNYMHPLRVETFVREEEDGKTTKTTIWMDGRLEQKRVPGHENPSARRDAVLMFFSCENCDEDQQQTEYCLEAVQHKGPTYFKWRSW